MNSTLDSRPTRQATPFHRTHLRGDGVQAMLLAIDESHALYRVQYLDGTRTISHTTRTSAGHFRKRFVPA